MRCEIIEGNMPILFCKPDAGDKIITQANRVGWHTKGISKDTGKETMLERLLSHPEQKFEVYQTYFDNQEIAIIPSLPGKIMSVDLSKRETPLAIQKRSFLAANDEVKTELYYQKKIGTGIFKKEDFIMLKLLNQGLVFLEFNGNIHEYELKLGDKLIISTGYLVAMDYSCRISVEKEKDNSIFNKKDSVYNTIIQGPGKVYLQTMSLNKLNLLQSVED